MSEHIEVLRKRMQQAWTNVRMVCFEEDDGERIRDRAELVLDLEEGSGHTVDAVDVATVILNRMPSLKNCLDDSQYKRCIRYIERAICATRELRKAERQLGDE